MIVQWVNGHLPDPIRDLGVSFQSGLLFRHVFQSCGIAYSGDFTRGHELHDRMDNMAIVSEALRCVKQPISVVRAGRVMSAYRARHSMGL